MAAFGCPPRLLKPDDLYPAWKWIDLMEQHGRMAPTEAQRWKDGIYALMELWGLGPEDVMRPGV